MAKTTSTGKLLLARPVARFHPRDSEPRDLIDLRAITAAALRTRLKVPLDSAKAVVALGRRDVDWSAAPAPRIRGMTAALLENLARRTVRTSGARLIIADVRPAGGHIMSDAPFTLLVDFRAAPGTTPALVHTTVQWSGKPFVVEQRLSARQVAAGQVAVKFGPKQGLPPGPAVFLVSVVGADGSQSNFRMSAAVLPSNPLSLTISPRTSFVTNGSSARGVKESGDVYRTRVSVQISNGNNSSVTILDDMTWKFWDGGVGGTLVESGTHDWGNNFTIAAHSTWTGFLTFTSPSGSGIYERYDDKEDMTIEMRFQTTGGTAITDTITARVMIGFGMNITRIGNTVWTSQEYTDLYDAVDVSQEIYEATNITFTGISRRNIADGSVGGYAIIDSEGEARDLFEDWSGPDNDMIDVFIVHGHTTGNDGMAGDIPGPTSHSGRSSGVWADKTGFTDGSGHKRLSVDYLGMLISHEVGHYLGLSHTSLAGNLMLSSSGTNDTDITYDQYRDTLDFGWMFIV